MDTLRIVIFVILLTVTTASTISTESFTKRHNVSNTASTQSQLISTSHVSSTTTTPYVPQSSLSSTMPPRIPSDVSTHSDTPPSSKLTSRSPTLATLPFIYPTWQIPLPTSITTLDSETSTTSDVPPTSTSLHSTGSLATHVTNDNTTATRTKETTSSKSVSTGIYSTLTDSTESTLAREAVSTPSNTTTEGILNSTVAMVTDCCDDDINCTSYLVVTIISIILALLITAINIAYFLFHRRRTRQTSEENLQDVKVYDFPEYIIITKKCIGHKKFDPEILHDIEIMCDPFDAVITVERIQSPDYSNKLVFRAYED